MKHCTWKVRSYRRVKCLVEQLTLNGFELLLSLLLPLHILTYLLFIQTYGAHAVPSRPQMPPPVATPHSLVSGKEPYRQLAFQVAHQIRHCILWWNGHHKMHMICLHLLLQDFDSVSLFAQPIDLLPCVLCHLVSQDPISVLRR